MKKNILQPGHNCWCIETAERVSFLIDGASYFRALHDSLPLARHHFYMLCWDIDSRINLIHDADPEYPPQLGKFLQKLIEENQDLHGYILNWDYAMLVALDREWLAIYKLDWLTDPRLHFQLDSAYPIGGSHHQKVVVIDNQLGFTGGLDITHGRWDTPEHKAIQPKREHPNKDHTRPYHDLQMAVYGDVARRLGELCERRWHRATGEMISAADELPALPWPDTLETHIENVDVAIVRTEPAYDGHEEVRETEQLLLDAIAAAEHFIYIENQYFTTEIVANAIVASLEQEQGPEVVLALPLETEGWLAQNTMDVMRLRLLRKMKQADHAQRLRVYYPDYPDLYDLPINLHSKLLIIDDEFIFLGSANLNNRSMGLDSECGLAIQAQDEAAVKAGITGFRQRLLGEHLGHEVDQVAAAERCHASLIDSIESLRNRERTFRELDTEDPDDKISLLTESDIVDRERPLAPRELAEYFIPSESRNNDRRKLLHWLAVGIGFACAALLWRVTPLNDLLDTAVLGEYLQWFQQQPYSPLLVIGLFIISGLVVMPLTVLIVATVITFGALWGLVYAFSGAMLSALLTYAIGSFMGKNGIRAIAGKSVHKVSQKLARRGVLTMIFLRIVPVAPFTIVNLVAGASHIRFRDYLLGTLLGMTPGMIAIALVVDRATSMFSRTSWENVLSFLAVIALIPLAGMSIYHYLARKSRRNSEP